MEYLDNNNWAQLFIEQIININTFCIEGISTITTISTIPFSKEIYPQLLGLINIQNWNEVKKLEIKKKDVFNEYLDIVTFKDNQNRLFAATVYDSDELWQNPKVLDIILLA